MLRILLLFSLLLLGITSCKSPSATSKTKGETAQGELSEEVKRQLTTLFFDANKAKILGNYAEALNLYKQALTIDKSNAAVEYEIARLFADDGNFPAALSYANNAYEDDPNNVWYGEFLATLYAETGRLDESTQVYQNLLEKNPERYDYYFSLGNLLSAQGKYNEALELYSEMEELIGTSEELALQKQLIYIEQGKYDLALQEVELLIQNNPEEVRLYGMKAEIYERMGKQKDAVAIYEEMLVLDPNNGLVLLSLYEITSQQGDPKSKQYLRGAFEATDLSIDVKVSILLNYLAQQNLEQQKDEIIPLIESLEKAHPDEAKTYAVQGDVYYALNDFEKARDKFRTAVSLDPNRPPIWQQILAINSTLGDFHSMEEESARAIELFPQQPVFYLFSGVALIQNKSYEEALETLISGRNLVIDNNPLLAQFSASLGDVYHELEDHANSDKSYDEALKYDPNNVVVLNNYAYYLSLRNQNLELAEKMAKKANDLSPNQASFQDTYGWVLFKRGNIQNALFWIEQSLQNGGANDPVVLEHHGDVLEKVNKSAEAVIAWEKAIEAGGDEALLRQKIERLRNEE
jgi:tetratricopeptide (TPR) repeat protein